MPDQEHAASPRAAAIPGLRMVGIVASVALVVLVMSLEHWVVFDDAFWRAILQYRGCTTDARVDRLVDVVTFVLTGLFVLAATHHARAVGVRSAWPWVATSLLGLMAGKTLKNLLTRERPSMLPDLALGFSFPSAHVMNSLIAMIAVMALTAGARRRGWWSALAAVLAATVTVGRVVLGRHWASDVLGGWLAALALVGLAVPAIVRRPFAAPVVLGLALLLGFAVDRRLGADGMHLPSPLVGARSAAVGVEIEAGARAALSGPWGEPVPDRTVGSLVWLDGPGTVAIDVPSDSRLTSPWYLAFGGRSERSQSACLALTLALNGQPLGRFVPFSGWREYRLPVPPGVLRAGRNELTIAATTDEAPARFAFVYVRLVDRSGS